MKLKNLFWGGLVCSALAVFAACEPENGGENLGNPALTVSATELTFEEAGGDQSLTLNATRDWKVTSTAEWVVVNPASGQASADDQTVVVSAVQNEGGNRNATLTFTIGMVSKTVKVSQVGTGVTPGVPSEGDGTEASPYSASQALEITKAMEKDVLGTNTVYIKGIVAQIKEAYSDQYGNVSFYVTDDGVAVDKNDMFLVFRCKYFGNEKFSSADQLKVGDEVVVVGNLLNYYGNTPELKNSYVVKINGETSGGTVTPPAGDENEGEGEEGGNEEGGNEDPVTPPAGDVTGTSLTISRETISNISSWTTNSYGSQNISSLDTYLSWSINGCNFIGAKLCLTDTKKAYAATTIQGQGNTDSAKQCRLGNTTSLGKIKQITIVTYNESYTPNFNLAIGATQQVGTAVPSGMVAASSMTTTKDQVNGVDRYTSVYVPTTDAGFFAIYKNTSGALYIESVTVEYELN